MFANARPIHQAFSFETIFTNPGNPEAAIPLQTNRVWTEAL